MKTYKGKYKVDPNMTIGDALEEYNTARLDWKAFILST